MKKIFLICSIFLLALIVAFRFYISNNMVFKENIITQKEFDKIISTREEYKEFLELKFNNNLLPYDKIHNYFLLSQVENENNYNGAISIDNFEIDVLENNRSKGEIIANNDSLVLLAYNNEYYKIINLKLTYFPVMKLDNYLDEMTIYENDAERSVLSIQNHKMEYHIRGASTAIREKPSYKLNILNSKGNKKKVTLLNMREDDDWILNSMTTDRAYMLEKIAYTLYGKMTGVNLELKYIELFIDNEYKGIYCLQEPADFKTYNANKNNSLIVQIKAWETEVNTTLFDNDLKYSTLIDEFELDSKMDTNMQIELLRIFASDLKGVDYSSNLELNYDIETFVDHSLLINMISALDNTYKNQKILFRYSGGEYIVESYPWDLDMSQNNEITIYKKNFLNIVENMAVPKMIYNSEEYKQKLKDRYFELRKSIYNREHIDSLIDANKNELEKSGAILREEMRWGDRDLDYSTQNIKDFYSKKIELLDGYYGGI